MRIFCLDLLSVWLVINSIINNVHYAHYANLLYKWTLYLTARVLHVHYRYLNNILSVVDAREHSPDIRATICCVCAAGHFPCAYRYLGKLNKAAQCVQFIGRVCVHPTGLHKWLTAHRVHLTGLGGATAVRTHIQSPLCICGAVEVALTGGSLTMPQREEGGVKRRPSRDGTRRT